MVLWSYDRWPVDFENQLTRFLDGKFREVKHVKDYKETMIRLSLYKVTNKYEQRCTLFCTNNDPQCPVYPAKFSPQHFRGPL